MTNTNNNAAQTVNRNVGMDLGEAMAAEGYRSPARHETNVSYSSFWVNGKLVTMVPCVRI